MTHLATAEAPHLAAVPRPKAPAPVQPAGGVDPHLTSLLDPTSFEAEQYRVLRHQLEQLKKSGGLSVIALTSPTVGDGKTTTSVNLAGALAQAPGARVMLIDGDLRRPAVGTSLGLAAGSGPGFVGAISDPGTDLESVARQRTPFNLHVVTAGRMPELPYELLRSPRVGELIADARERYDYVVIDTPPVLLVPDCRALEKWVDGFLVVVAANRTPRRMLGETLDAIDPGKIIGIVFNSDLRPLGGYYKKYGYQYYRAGAGNGSARGKGGHETWR